MTQESQIDYKQIATEAHKGQYRRDGITPYIVHPESVAMRVKASGGSQEAIAVAWLHDVLEDTPIQEKDLQEMGVPQDIIGSVKILTKEKGQKYQDFILEIAESGDEIAIKVKIADILSNLSDSPSEYQIKKYAKALLILV
jgi:(p)ppGpp synthase/HD superfamily hydrolase